MQNRYPAPPTVWGMRIVDPASAQNSSLTVPDIHIKILTREFTRLAVDVSFWYVLRLSSRKAQRF